MRRGPKRKPLELHKLSGNPSKLDLKWYEDHGAKAKAGIPNFPSRLKDDKEAVKEFKRMSKELYALGLLSTIDRAALVAYCVYWSQWIEARDKLQKTSMLVKGSAGNIMINPLFRAAEIAMFNIRNLCAEFGMTPSSRSKILLTKPQGLDDDETFLRLADAQ